jgi:hypothetical protein
MYGILAACIVIMALFLGLFAISIEPSAEDVALTVEQTAQAHAIADHKTTSKH